MGLKYVHSASQPLRDYRYAEYTAQQKNHIYNYLFIFCLLQI